MMRIELLQENSTGTDFSVIDETRSVGLCVALLNEGERNLGYWRSNSAVRGIDRDPDLLDRAIVRPM